MKRPDWPSWLIMGAIVATCAAIFVYVVWLS